MYFYREYGGKEVDLVLADYHKRYACAEMKKSASRTAGSVFPLPHSFRLVNPDNYQELLAAKEKDLFSLGGVR